MRALYRQFPASLAVVLLVTSVLLLRNPFYARADTPIVPPSCSLEKISKDTPYSHSISADGTRLAIVSLTSKQKKRTSRPWAWADPAYTERFFLLDTRRQKRTKIAKYKFTGRARITFTQMSANGAYIVFATAGNPIGENADGNSEIFRFNVKKKRLSQITHTTDVDHFLPAISSDGKRIAFLSTVYSAKESVEDRQTTLSFFDVATRQRTEVAHTDGFLSLIWDFSLSADGTKLALAANLDPTGGNPDGTVEIFLWDAATQTFTQITNTIRSETNSGNSSSPSINADGIRVVFNSVANLTGENPDGNFELFLFDSRIGIITQLTHSIGDSGLYTDPSISADGTKIVFEGNKDLLTGNIDNVSDGNDSEIFLIDTLTRTLTQLTNSNGTSASPRISSDGTHIAFISRILVGADLSGYNSGDRKPDPTAGIYLATCP